MHVSPDKRSERQAGLFVDTSQERYERLQRIQTSGWIRYPIGEKALNFLQDLYDAPPSHRPLCTLLYGDTNNGKTTITIKFQKDHMPETGLAAEVSFIPVLRVETPPIIEIDALFRQVLWTIGAPMLEKGRKGALMNQAMTLLTKVGTRLLVIDEIHNILAGRSDQRDQYLKTLKYLSNVLKIPIVTVGTLEALRAMQTDDQIGNRFEPFLIPRWKPDKDFSVFLATLCGSMGLEKKNDFNKVALVKRFHAMSEGLTGEARNLMVRAAKTAITSGREVIDDETLDNTDWARPSDRRKG
ncbi:MAG: TniB family NTP-binding protein [Magnetococcales bacterium]|nr:TniB family NTP-binding protein [Magnetococcales bacterium]